MSRMVAHMERLSLGPERGGANRLGGFFVVRIADDLRKSVVFFGFPDSAPNTGGIACVGTGFLLSYDGFGHLVTAKHLAHGLADNPFILRINRRKGAAEN